jgi:hypothetical protein
MSLSNASISSGATVAPTGGSALAFAGAGARGNSHLIYATADTDLRTRRSIMTTVREPKPSSVAPNGYTQARTAFVLKSPLELDNGNLTVNTVRIEFSFDVETTQTEIEELRVLAAQICSDADFESAVKNQSLE